MAVRNCDFYGAFVRNELNLPLPTEVPPLNPAWNSTEPLPFVFVGDDVFPLNNFCMKPYPFTGLTEKERLLNFRLSLLNALSKIHSGYGAIDSAYFQQEFACNLKKLHHAP